MNTNGSEYVRINIMITLSYVFFFFGREVNKLISRGYYSLYNFILYWICMPNCNIFDFPVINDREFYAPRPIKETRSGSF